MKLESSHASPVSAPTLDDVDEALRSLDEPDSFVILARADEDYIQATAELIEYRRDGQHFHAPVTDANRPNVTRAFHSFHDGNEQFKTLFDWKPGIGDAGERMPGSSALHGRTMWVIGFIVLDAIILLVILGWVFGWLGPDRPPD